MARWGGLLRQDGQRFDFYIRQFREFLAGRYLAQKLEEQWPQYLHRYVLDDQWEEPIQLAGGFLAYSNIEKAEKFVRQLVNLEGSDVHRSHTVTLAGLIFADLLKFADEQDQNVFSGMKATLPSQMLGIFTANPPKLKPRLRRRLGLALGNIGDPRFMPLPGENFIRPTMLPVPQGSFLMGTSDKDESLLKEQQTKFSPDRTTGAPGKSH